ncbi:hypothetical protein R70006_04959 [Paraburkholderia domus]|uniref:hypothetical protein n=1 Tax=Paraburkholderia domus TaxID=2793075 RepID=UPI0019144D03|nr:hypothetical protein [Paraburkholderia domus]MBK5051805.1 hypothetical protein [Burkholderia sp. R-70006]CAE6793488.1 hypothetical protein R70006_04959 [Paraburkholderia domus]
MRLKHFNFESIREGWPPALAGATVSIPFYLLYDRFEKAWSVWGFSASLIGLYLSAFLAPLGLLVVRLLRWRAGAGRTKWAGDLAVTVGVMIALPFVTQTLASMVLVLFLLYQWAISPDVATALAIPVLLGATLLTSGLLFWFRLKYRCMYGCSEALVGILVASAKIEAAPNLSAPQFLLLLLTAGIYLIVRGLDNMHQGATRAPLDPVGVYVKAKLVPRPAAAQDERSNADGE